MASLRELAQDSKAWPFEEARKLIERLDGKLPEKGYVLFETGYGPSGLPHIGTFGEVARTTMVRHAFSVLSDMPTRLFAFSDDMDGLRKVPDNVPNKDVMEQYIGQPLTKVPDHFSNEYESFGHHNNARLRAFLDHFGFEYEFQSSTDWYNSGRFDGELLNVLRHYDDVMAIMLKTLREERRQTYSPFLPISPTTGRVLQVPTIATNPDAGTITFKDEDGTVIEQPVTGGHCKLNWRPDWAMRWKALDVDYEMSGKDLIDSVKVANTILKVLGGNPPAGFHYELFLDEDGEKISKSRGNGLTIEEWLRYGTEDSLSLFMYVKPRTAKRLFFDVIPKNVDDYAAYTAQYAKDEDAAKRIDNPLWHIHNGEPSLAEQPLSYAVLLNLASVCNAEDRSVLWGFISRYLPGTTAETAPLLDQLAGLAVNYYQDFVKPDRVFRAASDTEKDAMKDLAGRIAALPDDADSETIQAEVYAVGKAHGFDPLRAWFKALYEVLLGQSQGPRFGSFVALYGKSETLALIDEALRGELVAGGEAVVGI